MFGLFKKKTEVAKSIVIAAPVAGKAVPITEVSDPVFSGEILGKGVGIVPTAEGKVYAPCDATVAMVFDTAHAVSLESAQGGAELLIHVGVDTVKLKGEHFTTRCTAQSEVKKGDLLLEFDQAAIAAEGYDTTVMVVVCNTDAYPEIAYQTGEKQVGDPVVEIKI